MVRVEIIFGGDLGALIRVRPRPGCTVTPVAGAGQVRVELALAEPAVLKDVLESLGVPHCEIGPVGGDLGWLGAPVRDGCRVEVGPVAPFPLADPRFLCDGHLGRLARLLRLLGFDTLWDAGWTEAEIARRGVNEDRTVLSRGRGLLKRKALVRAMLVRSDDPFAQVQEVAARFQLAGRVRMFGRCSVCNGGIVPVEKAAVLERIPLKTAAWLDEYFQCSGCGRLYWEGTHYLGLVSRLAEIGS